MQYCTVIWYSGQRPRRSRTSCAAAVLGVISTLTATQTDWYTVMSQWLRRSLRTPYISGWQIEMSMRLRDACWIFVDGRAHGCNSFCSAAAGSSGKSHGTAVVLSQWHDAESELMRRQVIPPLYVLCQRISGGSSRRQPRLHLLRSINKLVNSKVDPHRGDCTSILWQVEPH